MLTIYNCIYNYVYKAFPFIYYKNYIYACLGILFICNALTFFGFCDASITDTLTDTLTDTT